MMWYFFHITVEECNDREEYCKMDPDCNVNLVKENCPDYCNNCDIFESRRIIDQNGMYFDIIVPILNKMK